MSNAQFHLHHYPQQEALAALLLTKLQQEGQGDPFYKSHVLVRNQGMATWLKRRIATETGIAMQVEFPQPHTFLQEIVKSEAVDPEQLKWQIYEKLPSLLDRPNFSELSNYLQSSGNSREADLKRYQLSGIISGLFDKYLLYRPAWISAWQKGQKPKRLEPSNQESWQRELWAALDIDSSAHWSQILLQGESITLPENSPNTPQALHVFGISNFAPIYVRFLYQLSHTIPVHIYWMNPVEANQGYWEDAPNRSQWILAKEFDDPEIINFHNPLLASFGRLGREFVHTLYGGNDHSYHVQEEDSPWPSPIIPHPKNLLQSLQSSIYNNAPSPELSFDPNDTSISLHSCHTPLRELETLKTYLLTLAETSPLDAGDVLVMCPDIASYAPAIEAVFGGKYNNAQTRFSFSIGDSQAPVTDPAIAAVLQLFTLHSTRFTNQEALTLLSTPSIQQHFGLQENDISTIREWVSKNGIRWGFDAEHVHNIAPQCPDAPWTWRDGVERMLLGYAMQNSNRTEPSPVLWNGILPFHDIEGGNAHILGALCDFLDWCDRIRKSLTQQRPLQSWVEKTREWIDSGFDKDADSQQRLQPLYQTLENILRQVESTDDEDLPVEVFTAHLNNQLETSNSPRGFLSGSITFCEMKPMRAIPSRVICMLGMNHDTFPRKSTEVQFDLTRHDRQMGDRSTRDDDTYSFLEALLSARESLYISYIGTSIKDGKARPPSTALQTLLDYVPGLSDIVQSERLHAFDPHYFTASNPLSHDTALLKAAEQLLHPHQDKGEGSHRSDLSNLQIQGLEPTTQIEAAAFIRVLTNPAKHFLTNILKAKSIYKDNPLEENEPLSVDGLTAYQMKSLVLEKRKLPDTQVEAWIQEGVLPVGTLGQKSLERNIGGLEEQLKDIPETSPMKLSVTIDGLTITGNAPIAEIDGKQEVLVINASKDNPKKKLEAWIYQLLASAQLDTPIASRIYGTDKNKITQENLNSTEDYQQRLKELVALYHSAQTTPLPHFPKTAEAYISTKRKDESDEEYERKQRTAALKKWEPGFNVSGESEDDAIQALFDIDNLFTDETFTESFITTTELIWIPIELAIKRN
jgi:exodeoxyribonuclease V gamma subunit